MAQDDVRIADFCCVKTTNSSSCCASRQKSVVGQPVIVQKSRESCLKHRRYIHVIPCQARQA